MFQAFESTVGAIIIIILIDMILTSRPSPPLCDCSGSHLTLSSVSNSTRAAPPIRGFAFILSFSLDPKLFEVQAGTDFLQT